MQKPLCPFDIVQKHFATFVVCSVISLLVGLVLQANVLYQCFKTPSSKRCYVVILIVAEYITQISFSGSLAIQLAFTMFPQKFENGEMELACLTYTWVYTLVLGSNFLGSLVIMIFRAYCLRQPDLCSNFKLALAVGICVVLGPLFSASIIMAQAGRTTGVFKICANIGNILDMPELDKTYFSTILMSVFIILLFWQLSNKSRGSEQHQDTAACEILAPFQREKNHLIGMGSTIWLFAANVALLIFVKLIIFLDPGDEVIVVAAMTYIQLYLNLVKPLLHTLLSKWLRHGLIKAVSALLPTRYFA